MIKKFALKALLFTLTLPVLYFGAIVCLSVISQEGPLPNIRSTTGGVGFSLLRMREVQQVKQVDFLFVGSSHVYRGFDPRIFDQQGIRSFNLGSPLQTPFNSYFVLKEHLPNIKAKYIVMDLYWDIMAGDGVESSIDLVSNMPVSANTISMTALNNELMVTNSLLYAMAKRLHTPLTHEKQKTIKTAVYTGRGYAASLKTSNQHLDDLRMAEPVNVEPSDMQLRYLQKIISLAEEQGAQMIFVLTPVTKEYKNTVANYKQFSESIHKLAAANGIVLLDYNTRTDLKLSSLHDFYDKHHLTQEGVQKFNTTFIRDLQKLGYIQVAAPKLAANDDFDQ
ncbi:DUF1574 family protein [Pontibacter vulgaris]|uniref:DUF1574 family protein n=1 Tax=Pontibacter vulgaris TaxID=2905679 RepID=UPI001FA7A426|nr:DUF1574 family protein [Pontibacter vulgaris]